MFEKPILIYSDYCVHSNTFITTLIKYKELFDSFGKLNIDVNPQTKTRPEEFYSIQNVLNYKITEVPTIIINNGEYILSGEEAFKWLDYTINTQFENKSGNVSGGVGGDELLEAFNPNEMGSFSDTYASVGSGLNDATNQSFKFIGIQDEKIITPEEGSVQGNNNYTQRQIERNNVAIEHFNNSNTMYTVPPSVDFMIQESTNSQKKENPDKLLEQLMMEREQLFVNQNQNRKMNPVNFKA